jgi:hypothetical protein
MNSRRFSLFLFKFEFEQLRLNKDALNFAATLKLLSFSITILLLLGFSKLEFEL